MTKKSTKGTDDKEVAKVPTPENPIANHLATGTVPGITGAPTEPGEEQDSEGAKQPDIPGEINESVVNPVAAPAEPQGVPEAVERAVAVPNAQDEPTFHNGEDYNRLKAAFLKLCERVGHTHDHNYVSDIKKEAGIL